MFKLLFVHFRLMSVSSLDNESIFYSRTQKPHKTNPYLSMSPKTQQNSQIQSEHACEQNQKKFRATEPNKTALRAQSNYKYIYIPKKPSNFVTNTRATENKLFRPVFFCPRFASTKVNLQHAIGCTWLLSLFLLYFHRRVWLSLLYIINSAVFFHFIFTLCIVCHIPSDLTNQTWWHHAKLKHLVSRCRNLSPCGIIYTVAAACESIKMIARCVCQVLLGWLQPSWHPICNELVLFLPHRPFTPSTRL